MHPLTRAARDEELEKYLLTLPKFMQENIAAARESNSRSITCESFVTGWEDGYMKCIADFGLAGLSPKQEV